MRDKFPNTTPVVYEEVPEFARENPTRWQELIGLFQNIDEDRQNKLWELAELTIMVEDEFGQGDRYRIAGARRDFAREVNYAAKTLYIYSRTARCFPDGVRAPHLTFTHHRIIAMSLYTDQDRLAALKHAADNDLSVSKLQTYITDLKTRSFVGVVELVEDEGKEKVGLRTDDGQLYHLGGAFSNLVGQRIQVFIELLPPVGAEEEV